MRTVAEYITEMDHALGRDVASGHSLLASFNRAMQRLYVMHDWSWREATAVLALGQLGEGDRSIDLPADFGRMKHVYLDRERHSATVTYQTIEVVTMGQLARLRAQYTGNAFGSFSVCFTHSHGGGRGVTSRPVMEFYPGNVGGNAPTLTLLYDRQWLPVVAGEEDSVRPPLPEPFDEAVALMARAVGIHFERQEAAFEDAELVNLLQLLANEDAGRQVEHGMLRGGVNSRFMQPAHIRLGHMDVST